MVDPLLMAELVLALLIVATLDHPRRPLERPSKTMPAPHQAERGWSAETDLHAQRILRPESRAGR